MAKSRQIHQVHGLFVGPAPNTGYHFIDNNGVLNNLYTGIGHNNTNLLQPITRVQSVAYEINTQRTDIKQLGKQNPIARPILEHPTVNLTFDYLQMGLINEARMGFFVNYAQVLDGKSGEPYYLDNFSVGLLSGFVTRDMTRVNNEIQWPRLYRDKRNIFIGVGRDGVDLNKLAYSGQDADIDNIVAFGNCYLTSYQAQAAVGDFPRCTVSYLAENMVVHDTGTLNRYGAPGNLFRHTNFTGWTMLNASGQTGFVGPYGDLDAFRLSGVAYSNEVRLNLTPSPAALPVGAYEFSVFAKTGTTKFATLNVGGTGDFTYTVNLETEASAFMSAGTTNPRLQNVGSGWYKMSFEMSSTGVGNFNVKLHQTTLSPNSGKSGDFVYYARPQARLLTWIDEFVTTSGTPVTGLDYKLVANINEIPALNPQTKQPITGIYYSLPSSFRASTENRILLPGDITININSLPAYSGIDAVSGSGISSAGNLVRSTNLAHSSWSAVNVTVEGATGPYGDNDAVKVIGTANGTNNRLQATSEPSILPSGTYEFSVFARKGNTPFATLNVLKNPILDATYTVNLESGTNVTTFQINNPLLKYVGNNWYRMSFELPSTGVNTWIIRTYQTTLAADSGHIDDYVYYSRPQIRRVTWPDEYVATTGNSITGRDYQTIGNITNLGVNLQDAKIQSYDINLNLPREPLNSLTHKLPVDRPINFPVYANLNFSMVMGADKTGSLVDLLCDDDDYNITIKLRNPYYSSRSGTAIQYDFRRAKFQNVSFQNAVNENKIANLSFTTEIDPYDFRRGLFISGLLNVDGQQTLPISYLLLTHPDGVVSGDGGYLLQEDGGRIAIEEFTLLY